MPTACAFYLLHSTDLYGATTAYDSATCQAGYDVAAKHVAGWPGSSSTPTHSPGAKWVSPTNRTVAV